MQVTLLPKNEHDDIYFATKINLIEQQDNICYVLVDNNFVVQYFTSNADFLLKLEFSHSGNLDITKRIKELNEDISAIDLSEEKSYKSLLIIKKQIINGRFSTASKIRWREMY